MKDKNKQDISIGDIVAYAPAGAYAGLKIGVVVKMTEKMVHIEGKHSGRHMMSLVYKCYPADILVVNKIYND